MLVIIDLNAGLNRMVLGQAKLASQISFTLENGYCLVARTYKVTPRDQTSLAGVEPHPPDKITSGAK